MLPELLHLNKDFVVISRYPKSWTFTVKFHTSIRPKIHIRVFCILNVNVLPVPHLEFSVTLLLPLDETPESPGGNASPKVSLLSQGLRRAPSDKESEGQSSPLLLGTEEGRSGLSLQMELLWDYRCLCEALGHLIKPSQ